MTLAEDVQSQRGLVHEIDRVRSGRDVVIGEDCSACEFEIGREAAMSLKIPLQSEWIESNAIGSVRGLENQKDRDSVDCILESSTKEAGKMRARKDPSVAQSGVEGASIAPTTADGVTTASPYLNFVPTLLGPV